MIGVVSTNPGLQMGVETPNSPSPSRGAYPSR